MKEPTEKLSIRFGKNFEASANGRFAIVALLLAGFGYLAGKALGWW